MSDIEMPPTGLLAVLPCTDVAVALRFYTESLGFKELFRQPTPDGTLVNARVTYAGGQIMFNLKPEMAAHAGGGVFLWFRLFDDDIDELYQRFVNAEVTIVEEIGDRFWGDRSFTITDHAGFHLAFNQALEEHSA